MDRLRLPKKLYFSSKTLPKRVIISYIFDYVIIIVLLIVIYALDAVEPFHQHFSLRNYTIQYPFAEHERVPISLLFTLNSLLPAIVIAVYTLLVDGLFSHQPKSNVARDGGRTIGRYKVRDRLWELNCGILGLLLAQGAAFVITGALKNATGKPRPDLIDRCRPQPGSADLPVFGLSNSTICTQRNHLKLKDGFRSFPSGHSSSAFAGLFYLSLYLAGKMHLFDNRGEVWKTFVVLVPTLGASLIAVSRIMDARHHPFDVISGSLLGIAVAWCAYRQYFPPLGESWRKGRAFPIRTWGTDSQPVNHGAELIRTFGGPSNNFGQQQEPPDGPGGNVFRQQISRSQRQRQPPNPPFTAVSSTSSLDFEPSRAHLKPLPGIQPQTRHMHHDGYYSSTSDQETDDIELQPQHRGTLGNGSSDQESSGERQANFGQDTSYHPQAQSGGPAVSHTAARSAPLAHTMIRTPVPEPGDDESQRPSGVQLVETYKGQSH